MPLLTREEAQAIADRALRASKADAVRVIIGSSWSGNTRFSGNEITTSGGITDTAVSITSTVGKRQASATTNLLDEAGLARAVEQSERLARLSPEDPELMPELEPQTYAEVQGFATATAELDAEKRAAAVRSVFEGVSSIPAVDGVRPADLFVAGFLEATATAQAIANSKGLFAYHRSSDASLSTTVRTPDGTGSGYYERGARDWSSLDPRDIGTRAARKAVASRNPQAIEPGMYTVVLEPQAVSDLLPILRGSFNARSADEGRSPFSKPEGATKVGEKIADERVTIFSDPTDAELLSQPFDGEGLPVKRTVWIENGILKNLAYSRFWAQRKSVEPAGFGGGLKMIGGTKSTDDLIAGTERGILVTRFWYIRFLDQRTVMLTGLTRDGTFLIENGRVTRPLKNFRFNDSPLLMLSRIDEIGRSERVSSGMVMPSLRVRDFNFSSLSDAV
ncbi:MAG TPA: TldD/PmbA family protein [Gemmatimonadaceae bacterium]|nr:TldD/PmbA family protein [Gemmatimonadaceae bacterium]